LGPVEHQSLVRDGLLLDVTDRLAGGKLLNMADMRKESTAEVAVDGRYYGVPQGLATPDFTSIYINEAAFAAAGIPLPSQQKPLTYAALGAIARKLASQTGRPAFYSYFFERAVTAVLAERGGRMFNDDFTAMTLTGNPLALEVIRYFYDLQRSGAMYSVPEQTGIAFKFENGELPMSQSGYWMGAVVTPGMSAYGHVTMLPPPVWDRNQAPVSAYLGGTRLVISSASAHPDQAYRFIEWYAAGPPAQERARRGWGFPLLRSMEGLLPQKSAFDRQRMRVALDSLKWPLVDLPEYPYPSILPTFNQSWARNMGLARSGQIDFQQFASNLQEDVNLAIRDDVARSRDDSHR
jgi:multiple sugar transport system substrate-binding protein